MKRCPQCAAPNPDNAKRCFKCRTDLAGVEISAPAEPVTEEQRRAEFALIMAGFFARAKNAAVAMTRRREVMVLILIVIGVCGIMPSLKGGFGVKLAVCAGGLLLWYCYSLAERLAGTLELMRRERLVAFLTKKEDSDDLER